jgi:hypothetical protein
MSERISLGTGNNTVEFFPLDILRISRCTTEKALGELEEMGVTIGKRVWFRSYGMTTVAVLVGWMYATLADDVQPSELTVPVLSALRKAARELLEDDPVFPFEAIMVGLETWGRSWSAIGPDEIDTP